jgi:anti-anti-sigma factor
MDPMISVDLIDGDPQQPRVHVRGEIDMLTVASFRATLGEIVRTIPPGSTLTIDAAGIGFLSVDGVRVFLQVADHLRLSGSELVVAPASAAAELMLRVAGLDGLLDARSRAAR